MTIPSLLWGLDLAPVTVWSSPRLRAQRTATLAGLHVDEIVDDLAEWAVRRLRGDHQQRDPPDEPGLVDLHRRCARRRVAGAGRRARATGCWPGREERCPRATSRWSVTGTCPGCWPMRWVGLPIAAGELILMNPAAITVLGHLSRRAVHRARQRRAVPAAEVPGQSGAIRRPIPALGMPEHRSGRSSPATSPAVVRLVHELAEYEREPESCHLTTEQLHAALFGQAPALFGLVGAEDGRRSVVGFALYFLNFSTWEGVHGIYLEDLYVRPDRRGTGLGRALLTELARIAVDRGYARVEWSVLDWNEPAIGFYRSLGAVPMDRLDGLPAQRSCPRRTAAGTG